MQEAANQGGLTAHEVEDAKTFEDEPIIAYAIPRSYEGRRGVLQTVSLLRQKRRASFRHQTKVRSR
jgi:hypothetical protein